LDIRIRFQTHYPAGYPTGKLDSDHLWQGRSQDFSKGGAEVMEAKAL